jgi:hypothetical protein
MQLNSTALSMVIFFKLDHFALLLIIDRIYSSISATARGPSPISHSSCAVDHLLDVAQQQQLQG